ncbi:MAG: hypothetical protein R3B49_08205 [Phycisphaerales bacterium]
MALLSDRTAARGWTEPTPALVQVCRGPRPGADRGSRGPPGSGRKAEALHPGRGSSRWCSTALDPTGGRRARRRGRWPGDRTRSAAWELPGELDPTGERRAGSAQRDARIAGPQEAEIAKRTLESLDTCYRELACFAEHGDGAEWLLRLRATDKETAKTNAAWWGEARGGDGSVRACVRGSRCDTPRRLLASIHRPAW